MKYKFIWYIITLVKKYIDCKVVAILNKHGKVGAATYFIIKYLMIGLIISGSILLICYIIGRRSPGSMSDILTYAGAAILGVGVSSIFGTQSSVKDLNGYQYARSTGDASSSARLNQDFKLIYGAYGFMIKALIISIVPFVLSIFIF